MAKTSEDIKKQYMDDSYRFQLSTRKEKQDATEEWCRAKLVKEMLKPVIVGLGWFAGSPAEERQKRMDAYLSSSYGLCGCGKPVRYLVPNSKEGSCNKYARCQPLEEKEMNSFILLELAKRWEQDAVEPENQDGAPEAAIGNAIAKGERQAKRECADALRMLVNLLGEKD